MAVIASANVVEQGSRLPIGNLVQRTVQALTTGIDVADEYIAASDLGVSEIVAISGASVVSAAATGVTMAFAKNLQTDAGTVGDNPGDLLVKTSAAALIEVTVVGRL